MRSESNPEVVINDRQRLMDLARLALDSSHERTRLDDRLMGWQQFEDGTEITVTQLLDESAQVEGAVLRRLRRVGQLVTITIISASIRENGPMNILEGTYLNTDYERAMSSDADYGRLMASLTPRRPTPDDLGEFLDSSNQLFLDSAV